MKWIFKIFIIFVFCGFYVRYKQEFKKTILDKHLQFRLVRVSIEINLILTYRSCSKLWSTGLGRDRANIKVIILIPFLSLSVCSIQFFYHCSVDVLHMSEPKSHNKFRLENAIPSFYVESSYGFFLPHQKSPIILSIYLQVVSGNPIVDIV